MKHGAASAYYQTKGATLPAGFGVGRVGPNYAWDPKADIFYASTMSKPAFKFQR